jgi:hypothetical protein
VEVSSWNEDKANSMNHYGLSCRKDKTGYFFQVPSKSKRYLWPLMKSTFILTLMLSALMKEAVSLASSPLPSVRHHSQNREPFIEIR